MSTREQQIPAEFRLERFRTFSAPPETILRAAVEHAILAPSAHNTQPWRFRMRKDSLEVRADRTRATPIVDPDDRELTISCGAALFHLRTAIECAGREAPCELLPEPSDPDLLARVRVGALRTPEPIELRLSDAMFKRRTHRARFMELEVSETLLTLLAEDAENEGAWLRVIDSEADRHLLADLIARADRAQWEDPLFRRELAEWVHSNSDPRGDGIPGYAMGLSSFTSVFAPLVVRTFDRGDGQAARDRELAEHSPALVILGTQDNRTADWLLTGQALARVLLHATVEGVSTSYLNQPIERADTIGLVREMVGGGHPQIILRMGYGYETRGAPRRRTEEVLEIVDG